MAEVNADKGKKAKDPLTDTALHVLKGAVVRVLNTPITTSTDCKNKTKAKLAVEYNLPNKPSEEQVMEIEDLANKKIRENVEVEQFRMDKKEAEEKYRKEPVNNTFIYDKFPVPDTVSTLALLHIKDWNINCCPSEHLQKTGGLGALKILQLNHRPQKNELEFSFEIFPDGQLPQPSKVATSSSSKKVAVEQQRQKMCENDDVEFVTDQILAVVLQELGSSSQISKEEMKHRLGPNIEMIINSCKNTSFSRGFHSHVK